MKIKGLTIIFFLALSTTFWINFIDFKFYTLSFFNGKEVKLENIIDNFCLSYIAGYFFYFINIYLVEKNDKKSILPYITFKIVSILNRNNHLIQVLKRNNKLEKSSLNREDFKELITLNNIKNLTIYNFEKYTFLEYLEYNRKSILKNINKILQSGKYVDDDLKVILFKMKESLFLKKNYAFNSKDFNLEKFETYYNVFFKYFEIDEELHKYYKKNLKEYYRLNFPKHFRKKIKNSL